MFHHASTWASADLPLAVDRAPWRPITDAFIGRGTNEPIAASASLGVAATATLLGGRLRPLLERVGGAAAVRPGELLEALAPEHSATRGRGPVRCSPFWEHFAAVISPRT